MNTFHGAIKFYEIDTRRHYTIRNAPVDFSAALVMNILEVS